VRLSLSLPIFNSEMGIYILSIFPSMNL